MRARVPSPARRIAGATASLLVALALGGCAAPAVRCEGERACMGTRFRVVCFAPSGEAGERAIDAAFARVEELDSRLSDYDATSELRRLCARSDEAAPTGLVAVSNDLWRVLEAAQRISERSEGAFDVTVGPYVALWRRSRREGELPSRERLDEAARAVGWRKLRLDAGSKRVELLARGMRIDLGGIAKGYALDEALAAMRELGVDSALVDGGGDVAVGAPPPGRAGWRIELDPLVPGARIETIELARAAVATSGDAFRSVEIEGVRYSHLVDPGTGLGLTRRVGASVVARDGMTADALASAVCVLGLERGLALLIESDGVEGRILEARADALESRETPGFAELE